MIATVPKGTLSLNREDPFHLTEGNPFSVLNDFLVSKGNTSR